MFTIGVTQQSWLFMDLGRFFLGFGGESFKVANYALLPDWFTSNELAFVNAIASLSRFGNVLVNIISPNLATRFSLLVALLPGCILCFFALTSVLLLQYLNFRVENQNDGHSVAKEYELVRNPLNSHEENEADDDDDDDIEIPEIDTILDSIIDEESDAEEEIFLYSSNDSPSNKNRKNSKKRKAMPIAGLTNKNTDTPPTSLLSSFINMFTQFDSTYFLLVACTCCIYACMGPFNNIASTVLLERDFFKPIPSSCQLDYPHQCQSEYNSPMNTTCPSSSNYQLPLPLNYSTYSPLLRSDIDCTAEMWKTGCTEAYCHRLNNAVRETSIIMSIPFILFAITAVPLGKLIDKVGHRLEIVIIGILIFLLTHLLLATTDINAIILMIGQGLGNVLFITTYWPLLPLIVDKKVYGVAYGLAMSLQNGTYIIMPIILAKVYNASNDRYIPNVEYCFVIASILGLIPVLIIYTFKSYFDVKF